MNAPLAAETSSDNVAECIRLLRLGVAPERETDLSMPGTGVLEIIAFAGRRRILIMI